MQNHNVDYVDFLYFCPCFTEINVIKVLFNQTYCIMYYIICAKKVDSEFKSKCARNWYNLRSQFNDYDICVEDSALSSFLNITSRRLKNLLVDDVIYIVVNSDSSEFFYVTDREFNEHGLATRSYVNFTPRVSLNKISTFLIRLIHDCDKSIANLDDVYLFIQELQSGASPISLWCNYCWYRVFGSCAIRNPLNLDGIIHDAPF